MPVTTDQWLPLFPLNTLLFPDGVLPLRVFETRYVDMVRERMKADLPFGVVAILSSVTPVLVLPILWWQLRRAPAWGAWLGAGLTVAELPDQNARIELRFLIAEIKRILR